MGQTTSAEDSFPVIGGPDLTYNGGETDVFVAKVDASGTALVYCGYIGGTGSEFHDFGNGIAVDNTGNAYVTGYTASTQDSFPVIGGPDLTFNGRTDAFVAKISYSLTTLKVTSPAGGEAWIIGTTQGISWLSSGVSGNLNIYLFKGTSNLGAIATGIPVSNGVYNWKAGYLKTGLKVPAGSLYKISIVSAANKKIKATSQAYFSLVKPKISVKTPTLGTIWKISSIQRITWTFTAVSGTVNIFLYKDGALKGQVADSIPVGDLGFLWTVGALIGGTSVPSGTGYQVRVTTSDGKVTGKSRGTFTIKR
jgi:hypothetical protein